MSKRRYDRENNLRQILLAATRAINQDVTAALHGAGYGDLKNSEVFCLAHIDLEGASILEIAERGNVSKQATSKLVARLVKLGYLSTSPAPTDARSVIVRFTPRGHELMQRSFALFEELERIYSRQMGTKKYLDVKSGLRSLAGKGNPTIKR